jgi:hypothetical protein
MTAKKKDQNEQPSAEGADEGSRQLAVSSTAGPLANAAPGTLDFLASRAGQGMERVGMSDIIMPRVSILQTLSPQLKRNKPEFIEGAEEGKFVNAATREISDELQVLPCHYIRHHIEWKPNRGGFVADHGEAGEQLLKACKRNDDNYDVLPNGNLLVPTPTWYCIDLRTGQQIVIPMPRTQQKPSRQWMSLATSEKIQHPDHGEFTPPLFFRGYTLGSMRREEGENDWHVFTVERGPTILELDADGSLMAKATKFRDMLVSGEIKATAESFADDTGGDSGGRSTDRSDDATM